MNHFTDEKQRLKIKITSSGLEVKLFCMDGSLIQ